MTQQVHQGRLPEPPNGVRESAPPYRSVLVDVHTVVTLWSLPPATVLAMIECGQIRWAWDVSVPAGAAREVRVWLRELFAAELSRGLDVKAVIESVVGHSTEPRLRGQTVVRTLQVSTQTVHNLVAAGELKGAVEERVLWVTRASLVEFLLRRLIV